MRRHPSAPRSFRPQLEHLETRDLPSAAGLMLPNLIQPLIPLTQQLTSEVQQLHTDFNQLEQDVAAPNASPPRFPFLPATLSPTLATDYTRVGNDYGQIQALNAVITSTVKIDQAAIVIGLSNGTLDGNDLPIILQSFKLLHSVPKTAASNLAQATAIANTIPGPGFPTISDELRP